MLSMSFSGLTIIVGLSLFVVYATIVCVCVCVRERERERECVC